MQYTQKQDPYADIRLERQPRPRFRFLRRIIPTVLAPALFYGLWVFLPHAIVFWIVLPSLVVLAWIASYGWRQSLSALIEALQHLEQI